MKRMNKVGIFLRGNRVKPSKWVATTLAGALVLANVGAAPIASAEEADSRHDESGLGSVSGTISSDTMDEETGQPIVGLVPVEAIPDDLTASAELGLSLDQTGDSFRLVAQGQALGEGSTLTADAGLADVAAYSAVKSDGAFSIDGIEPLSYYLFVSPLDSRVAGILWHGNTTDLSEAFKLEVGPNEDLDIGQVFATSQPVEGSDGHLSPTQSRASESEEGAVGLVADVLGPVLVSSEVTYSHTALSEGPVQVTTRVRLTDATGVETPTMVIGHVGTSQLHGFGSFTLVEGTTRDGVWEKMSTIPDTAAPGDWEVTLYPLSDTLGNRSGGFEVLKKIHLTSTPADVLGPVLVSSEVTYSHTALSEGPVQVTTRVRLTDATGVETPTMVIGHVGTSQLHGFGSFTLVEGTTRDGVWEKMSTIPDTAAPGDWEVTLYPLSDTLGNRSGGFEVLKKIHLAEKPILVAPTVLISGATKVGQTLTATGAGKTDFTPAAEDVTYRWLRDGTPITGATSSTYLLTTSDVGKDVSVEATGTKPGYTSAVATSQPVTIVEATFTTIPSVTISGTTKVGETLTATGAGKADFTPAASAVAYQWLRDGTPITGATSSTYLLTTSDVGKDVSVEATGTKPGYTSAVATSQPVTIVDATFTTIPSVTISGATKVGQTLTATGAGKTDFTPAAEDVTYRWLRDGTPITGATSSTYLLTTSDVGKDVSVEATGTKPGYTSAVATSQPVVIDKAPVKPTVSVSRVGGANRYATNYELNKKVMQPGKPLFVATGRDFPDALSIGPAVSLTDGALVLAAPTGISPTMIALINQRKPSQIFLVGGSGAVSNAIGTQLRDATGINPERVAGKDRFDTSSAIAQRFFGSQNVDVAFIATGKDFPDALSAASAGGAARGPVLLVNGTAASSLQPDMLSLLNNKGVKQLKIVGGHGVVSETLASNLKNSGFQVDRLSGTSRYQTNLAVNNYVSSSTGTGQLNGIWIATGTNFPDALSAAAPAGSPTQRLVLSNGNCIMSPVVSNWIKSSTSLVENVTLVGAEGALKDSVYKLQECK